MQFNKVQLYKVPKHDACAISICLRGFYRSAANAFQEFQLLASTDKSLTAGQKKGKVIFRNEKHSFALIFPDVVIKSHNCHAKTRQTNYSFREPNQFSLTNFHCQIVLRIITERMHFSSNPGTFVESAIKDNRGAWSIQVSICVFAKTANLFLLHTNSPWSKTGSWCHTSWPWRSCPRRGEGTCSQPQPKSNAKLKRSSDEAWPDGSTTHPSASFTGHLSKMPAYQAMSLPGSWCSQRWFKVEVQSMPGVEHFWAVFTVSWWWFTGFDYPFFITTKSEIKMFQRQLLVLISAAEAGSRAVTQGRDGIPAASTATRQESLKANTFL